MIKSSTAQQLWGSNVDGLITCFYNPQTMPKTVSEALDRAGVEQVLAGAKREAADRKICERLEREAAVLPRGRTAFVLISSDCDFAPPLRRLVQTGFGPVRSAAPGSLRPWHDTGWPQP